MLKIIRVKKIYNETSKDKYGNESKSFWCDVSYNGKSDEGFVKINLKHVDDIKDGAEFKNDISFFTTKTGKNSYFIKQPKKDGYQNSGYKGGKQMEKYTLDEANELLKWCSKQKASREAVELFKVMTVMGIKIDNSKEEIIDKVKEDFPEAEQIDNGSVPFDPPDMDDPLSQDK